MNDKTKPKLKVLWLVYGEHPIHTGISVELGKKCDLNLVMRKRHEKDKFPRNNYNQIYLEVIEKSWNLLFFPNVIRNLFAKTKTSLPPIIYFKGLTKELNKIKPDVIISNICYMPASWQAAKYCKKRKIPFIIQTETQRMPPYIIGKIFAKIILKTGYVFNRANLILPWTKDGVNFMKQNLEPKNIPKIKLLTPGINEREYHNTTHKTKSKYFRIIMVARMIPYKKYSDLLLAISILKKKGYKNIRAKLRGDGPFKPEIEKQIIALGLQKEIELIPRQESMAPQYLNADVLILPSFNEAVGMVVPEAMACGTTAIVSDTAGANTYIENGKNGFIFKTGDYNELANKIEFFLKNNKRLEQFKKNAEKHIMNNYTNKKIAEKFYTLIKEAHSQK